MTSTFDEFPIIEDEEEEEFPVYDGEEAEIQVQEFQENPIVRKLKEYAANFDAKKEAQDYAKQAAMGTASGFAGAYGNILDLFGINEPGKEAMEENFYEQEDILERMQRNEKTSLADLMSLVDDDVIPQLSGLPTTREAEEPLESVFGGPETVGGRYGKRTGQIYGSGVAFGQLNPTPALLAGTAGQTAEEAGADPLTQAAIEIATMIGTGTGKQPQASMNRSVNKLIKELRDLGYTEEEITLAVNAAKKNAKTRFAKRTQKAEESLEGVLTKSENLVEDLLSRSFPGIEEGIPDMQKAASAVYQETRDAAKLVKIPNKTAFTEKAQKVIQDFEDFIQPLPDSQQSKIISALKDGLNKLENNPNANADELISLYQRFGQLGKWVEPKKRERLLNEIRTSIKKTIGDENPEVLKSFNNANKVWTNYEKAKHVNDFIENAMDAEGRLNFNKLKTSLDNTKKRNLLKKNLGETEVNNLTKIAKVGKDIKNFDSRFGKASQSWPYTAGRAGLMMYGLYKQDWRYVALTFGSDIASRLATRSLTDPRFQNLLIRGMNAVKQESPKLMNSASRAMEKYLNEEGYLDEEEEFPII